MKEPGGIPSGADKSIMRCPTCGNRWYADRWIPVEEKPKPDNQLILVGLTMLDGSFEQHLCYFDTDTGTVRDEDGEYFEDWGWGDYTHWQPLPDKPKEKE